ncbi:hypothetical protein [Idiomarina xiamenensis]|uniref:YD repeat-containing protein n=1 Tax=Idiomarina xiamenensis 10-D-4 TaxID=740709 RepID=K2K515_9GAMM|nr:hypothetical protein [Idiomarina xiamenensis]EKE78039.1 YD repeat-containing protein [Idiomarina xiamenensis 10-D-4]
MRFLSSFFFFSIFLSLCSFSSIASEVGSFWKLTICNDCSSEMQFRNTASLFNSGNVVIFNLELNNIRAYSVERVPRVGEQIQAPIPVPAEAYDALNKYYILKDRISFIEANMNSTSDYHSEFSTYGLSGPFGGICGPEGSDLATWIPDGVFSNACSGHDQCYSNGNYSKMFCDDLFKESLKVAIINATDDLNVFLKFLTKKALEEAAYIYYKKVVESESAYNAYCTSGANNQKSFCMAGHEANQAVFGK